jgi:hypothetical protein
MLTWFHYNKSINFSPLPTTDLIEIHKKKKKKNSKNVDES